MGGVNNMCELCVRRRENKLLNEILILRTLVNAHPHIINSSLSGGMNFPTLNRVSNIMYVTDVK